MSNPIDNPEEFQDFTLDDGTRISWSHYHPMDHWPRDARCRRFYGGWRGHLSTWRRVMWPTEYWPALRRRFVRPWWRRILCRAGIHRDTVIHGGKPGVAGFF